MIKVSPIIGEWAAALFSAYAAYRWQPPEHALCYAVAGEIIIGVVLGPNAADLVPYESFFRLAGLFGVTLMIFESGLHVDFGMLKEVGAKATGVAILGTLMPLGSGMLLMMAFDDTYTLWPVGLACGVTLAPTSVGMALKMLGEKKQLGEKYGQLIIAAAFIDDILSLVALTMLLQVTSPFPSTSHTHTTTTTTQHTHTRLPFLHPEVHAGRGGRGQPQAYVHVPTKQRRQAGPRSGPLGDSSWEATRSTE